MAKQYFLVDRGDAIELHVSVSKENYELSNRYEKDDKGFIPISLLHKLHELHEKGFKEVV